MLCIAIGCFLIRDAIADPCMLVAAGLDSTYTNYAFGPDLGQAIGQSFWADDTVITSVTMWRPPNNRSVIGANMFIVGTDSLGVPMHGKIYGQAQTLYVHDSEPPGNIIVMRFVFVPPIVLPTPGEYAFLVQAEGCFAGTAFLLSADHGRNDYAKGIYWLTGRSITSCMLPRIAGGGGNDDFVFRIEYCRDSVVPAVRWSWGRLKMLYR